MSRTVLLVLAIALVSACAHVDVGQVDYRVADPPGKTVECPTDNEVCPPRRPARLVRRNDPFPGPGFTLPTPTPPELYSISLEQGSMGSRLLEGNVFGQELGRSGEFVILANVFEFAGSDAEAQMRRFLQPNEYSGTADNASDLELKVVHFEQNIHRHQPMNFANIPIVSRRPYQGRSLGIQIVIMEVDASGSMASLVNTLAEFGKGNLPIPPGGQELLLDLGQSIFSARGGDDTILDYRFVLGPPGPANANQVRPTFAPGRYVIRRSQDRGATMNWNNLTFDHDTSRLYHRTARGYEEARGDLYLVLNITKWDAGTPAESYALDDWSTVRERIRQAEDTQGGPIAAIQGVVEREIVQRRSASWRGRLVGLWSIALTRLQQYAGLYAPEAEGQAFAGCSLLPPTERARMRDLAADEARAAIRNFIIEFQSAPARPADPPAGGTPTESEFRVQERDDLVRLVGRYFMPWDSEEERGFFLNSAAFESTFVQVGRPRDLIADSIGVATTSRRPAATCAELLEKGLATPTQSQPVSTG